MKGSDECILLFYRSAVSRSRLLSSLKCYYLQLLLCVCLCGHLGAAVCLEVNMMLKD